MGRWRGVGRGGVWEVGEVPEVSHVLGHGRGGELMVWEQGISCF